MRDEALHVQAHVSHGTTGSPFAEVGVEAVVGEGDSRRVIAEARTDAQGWAELQVDAELGCDQVALRLAGDEAQRPLSRAMLAGERPIVFSVESSEQVQSATLAAVADYLVATRRVRVSDVAEDIANPAADSALRLVPPRERARLLDDLIRASIDGEPDQLLDLDDARFVDPAALRGGHWHIEPPPQIPVDDHFEVDRLNPDFIGVLDRPGWDNFGWARPDDESYRDYLRGVFVLFAHQQKLGAGADATAFPDLVERQLLRRFFQDFRTSDHTETPVNKLLIPVVTKILAAPTGDGFGFAIPAASVPAQGADVPDRAHLDALLALAPVDVDEFANRYRLPLREPDATMSTPVLLNVHTLSRILSDTAQGPVEPPENVIVPQLPGVEGKPILWPDVVGSAPFFLRFDEWLARQQPFFPENLFAIRTQVIGAGPRGPWLDDARKKYLEYHQSRPPGWAISPYLPWFSSISEVNRAATFLLKYGAADAKLVELVASIDKNEFGVAARLVEEAALALQAASPTPAGSENWEPEFSVGFPRPLSLARRRKLKVSTITELTGTTTAYPPDGFERFFELARPFTVGSDVVHFRIALDQATRLRTYQQRFLIPMLRAAVRSGLGDLPGALEVLGGVTGLHIGIATLGTPAGMVEHPDAYNAKRVVASRWRSSDHLGDRPYTARLVYDNERHLDGPFPHTPQVTGFYDALAPEPPILHPLEEKYARLVQGDALLAWAETLYRTDDPASMERARELYKAVVFLHGEDPGTSAYLPSTLVFPIPGWNFTENPRRRNQIDRALLALQQLEAGLNFYGFTDEAVPTLRYSTLAGAAHRWAAGAKGAQNDYLAYVTRAEQLDLDLLAAKAQERKAQATVAIAAEQIEIAKLGIVIAQKLVKDVERLIAAKKQEIEDSKSLWSQLGDYFSGMKSGVSSLVDVGKGGVEGASAIGVTSDAQVAAAMKDLGSQALSGSGVAGGMAMLGAYGAFVAMSTSTLQGMADAATKREDELKALTNEALPAAQAAMRVQERNVTIAQLQAQIATSDLRYARDLIAYTNERFLNRDFWDALAGVARRSLHRYLDLAAQAAWFAERALAYQLATPIRVIRLGYFDLRMRDLGGVDRLLLDLAELEAVRLGAARVTVPITRTYSLARDLPLAFGALKRAGRCTFTLSDTDLLASHPGTFAHRIRAVDVRVETPGAVPLRGMLTNRGFSLLRRTPADPPVPLLRFADAYPVSEFRVRADLGLHGMPGEQLMPFEGTAFTTTWTLELPPAANPAALSRVTDVLLTFDLQASYDAGRAETAAVPAAASRSVFVSALAVDTAGLSSLRTPAPQAKVRFALNQLPLPAGGKVTNLAVVVPGVDGGNFDAKLRVGGATTQFELDDGLAMSNLGVLSDGVPANEQPLNGAAGGALARAVELEIAKGADAARLARARDVLLWVEYEVTA